MVKDAVKGVFNIKSMLNDLKESLHEVLDRSLRKLTAGLMMIIGILFLAIGGFYFLLEYLQLNRMTIFFSLGVLFIIISHMMNYKLLKEAH